MAALPASLCGPAPGEMAGAIDVVVRDRTLMSAIEALAQRGLSLEPLLRVYVARREEPGSAPLPPISGRHLLTDAGLRFTPHFPFAPGVSYRAVFDPRPLHPPGTADELIVEFGSPAPEGDRPVVESIYPSATLLPENLLRFHVCFSHPMRRGLAGTEVVLIGPDGQAVPDALYRAPLELWDKGMRRLTVLLDPGRLKRGVGPNRMLGPPLRVGEAYTLAIGQGMACSFGRTLTAPVLKRFVVTSPVREPVAAGWDVVPPAAGGRDPLLLKATRPLDWASLRGAVTVIRRGGQAVDGCLRPTEDEMGFAFTPAKLWEATPHEVSVDPELEDICGNRVDIPFERPLGADADWETPQALFFHPG